MEVAMNSKKINSCLRNVVLLSALAALGGNAWAASGSCASAGKTAGNVIQSQGAVQAQSGGHSRSLVTGDTVCVGDTIVTAKSGSAQIKMADDGMLTVRPQTKFKIEKFVYRGTKKDNSLFALLKGGLRVITGEIGHRNPKNDLIRAPQVLIGVRGTDHEVSVVLPGDHYPAGVYDKVIRGVTFIKTDEGEVEIHPNQVGFAESPKDIPILLNQIPEFYNAEDASAGKGQGQEEKSEGKANGAENGKSGLDTSAAHAPTLPDAATAPTLPNTPSVQTPAAPSIPSVAQGKKP
jgi:hypothetical protein